MNDDYTQSINDLWIVVLKEAASIMPRDSASMRAFFFAQIMKFCKKYRLAKNNKTKEMMWCRVRCRRQNKRGTKEGMLQLLEGNERKRKTSSRDPCS